MTSVNVLNTLIVDDEPAAIEGLRLRLEAFPQIRVIAEANSVAEAIRAINTQMLDLIFLDIEMPEQSGFELIRQLQPEQCPAIVFVTAFHQHAVKAFEVRALDYLLKPVKGERLAEAIARVGEVTSIRADKAQLLAAVAELSTEGQNQSSSAAENYSCRAAILHRKPKTGDPGRPQPHSVDPLSGYYLDRCRR